jgi:hypothetical protein
MHEPKTAADDPRPAEYAAHLFRRRGGGHVIVFRYAPQQQIAHCTADDVCSVSLLLQRLTRFQSTPAHVSALDAMSFERYDCRLPRLEQTAGKNLAEKTPDHQEKCLWVKQIERRT